MSNESAVTSATKLEYLANSGHPAGEKHVANPALISAVLSAYV